MVIWRQTHGKGPLRLAARILLYASSHRQDNTYQGVTPVMNNAAEHHDNGR